MSLNNMVEKLADILYSLSKMAKKIVLQQEYFSFYKKI